jgi:hypothetical protein
MEFVMSRMSTATAARHATTPATRFAPAHTVWSYNWEFGWSPAEKADARSGKPSARRHGPDDLGRLLDKALAFAG